ncbi:ricin-type beta-trefoil lectin domain protein [Acinetobacter gyllenbergii]|uniref:M66 family metalloprotease n=1 Tax=Acinetobacter gyllenbergii TaxID=134534 RepID=UPI0021CEFE40|nr:M66 family metalloprotease [Acinetobacter gyllenbergii]MCU4582976.1 ricin-type beta-trefoil lectin domain protein [Acinetobacter gyllenbergii]
MQLQLKHLTVCLLSIMMVACGGGGSDHSGATTNTEPPSNNNVAGGGSSIIPGEGSNELPGDGTSETPDQDEEETPSIPPVGEKYPEPQRDIVDEAVLGFYDYDKLGLPRLLRNDLNGSFAAMLQFAQSHVVNPKNNEKDSIPRLTTEKDALLLVTPLAEMGDLQKLQVEIYQGNQLLRTVKLKEPSRIAASDQSNTDGRPPVSYSKRAWTVALKWSEIRAGLHLRVVDPLNNRSGDLTANNIDLAAPGELVLQNIRLGLLTDPPKSTGHYMLLEPAKAGTDYFQTIPAARMIVAKYDDLKLNKVMVASGVIYDAVSATTGDVYTGDMREDTAKSTFGVGINLANVGATSASMLDQVQPMVFDNVEKKYKPLNQSVVAHYARGKYSNGEATHGLSGGNGMLTLIDSVGNEFSHEIGHHYGLGHYPGAAGTNMFWAAHHADSGWGYIAFRNKMRSNLNWTTTNLGDGANGVPNFLNKYAYGWDAMSGGATTSSISKYTHYTGYSTYLRIQPAFDRYVWDASSPTGYKKWNATTRVMEVAQPKTPDSGNVWYNRTDGNYLKPKMFGVPVYTILGGYDPEVQIGLVYPAAKGNWGNVFDLPQANPNAATASCWLNVQFASTSQNIALAPQRMGAKSNANKFHVNFAQSEAPQQVNLYCKKANQAAVLLSSMSIPANTTVLAPAVEIGKEAEYSALRTIELPQLEQALLENKDKAVVNLSPESKLLFDSYRTFKDQLSPDAQNEMVRYTQQQIKLYRLNRWINVYRSDLSNLNADAVKAFQSFVEKLALKGDLNVASSTSLLNRNNCLKAETLANGQLNAFISGPTGCVGDDSEKWVYDALGKIHNKQYIDQCLTTTAGNVINLMPCSGTTSQVWGVDVTAQAIKQSNQCFDLEGGYLSNNRARLIRYRCTSGTNQKWTIPVVNNSLMLAGLSAKNLPVAIKVLAVSP